MAQDVKTKSITPGAPPPGRMTYEEFLAWADEDTWAEWVDGEVIVMRPVSKLHQQLGLFLLLLLQHFVEAHQLGTVLYEPFQMKTGPELPGRSPDIIFVLREHLDRLKENYLDGPADLVVEIISPESRARDRGEKFYEYEQGGVREYWLIDPDRKQAEFYQRGEDGIYRLVPVDEEGIYRSAVLEGLWLKVAWLWQDPLPPLMSVIKEWGLV
ncbi:MAG: Uma2 family endonuclease [Acidobacteria bacterium]|nr:MAG: Uma2 family endonuclease [Acidobacteriota bacterium]